MIAAHHQREMAVSEHAFDLGREQRIERRHRMQRRVLRLARHAQDRVPFDVLQRGVVKYPVTTQRIRPLGGGRVGRAGAAGGADDDDAARGGNVSGLHVLGQAGVAACPSPPRFTYLVSRYSSMPLRPPSRPSPDCLTPPNAASAVDITPVLMLTMP